MFKKLLKIYQLRSSLEKDIQEKKQIFEDSIALQKAQLDDLKEQESLLREQAFLELEQKKLDSIKQDEHVISRQVKRTRQIRDINALESSMISNAEKVFELIPDLDIEIEDLFRQETVIQDKEIVNEIIDKFEKVEGKLLDGVEVKTTNFITIK